MILEGTWEGKLKQGTVEHVVIFSIWTPDTVFQISRFEKPHEQIELLSFLRFAICFVEGLGLLNNWSFRNASHLRCRM